jgi:hypothetical protein
MTKAICIGCGKTPDEIDEYIEGADGCDLTPVEYAEQFEGTFNPENGHFACTECYINMGMPAGGWIAP